MGRKGMSCERTFQAIGESAELEAKVRLSPCCCMWCHCIHIHSIFGLQASLLCLQALALVLLPVDVCLQDLRACQG